MRHSFRAGMLGKKRMHRPGYYLGVDKIGRKTWRVIDKYRKKENKDLKNGDIVKIDDKNNGVIEEVNKKSVVLKNYKNDKRLLLYNHQEHEAISSNNSNKIDQNDFDDLRRVVGTGMSAKQISEGYEALNYKIGQKLENENGSKFKVVGVTHDAAILAGSKGLMFSTKQDGKKLKVVEDAEDVNSEDVIGEAVGDFSPYLKNRIAYQAREVGGAGRVSSGAVLFIKDLKSLLSIFTGIYDLGGAKSGGGRNIIPALRGRYT